MKIGLYVPTWPPGSDANGIVTYAANAVPALRRLGHEVVVITPNLSSADPNAIDLRSYESRPPAWSRLASKISRKASYRSLVSAVKHLAATGRIEVIEIEETFGWSREISRLDIVPVVVRLHGPWFLTKIFEDRARERKELAAIKDATFVTAPSRSVLDSVIKRCGPIIPRSAVVYNSIDLPDDQWRLETCDKNTLLFVGRFDEIKGGDLVIRAFGNLAQKNKNLKLTFVGRDVGINGCSVTDYARQHLSGDVFERVTFTGPLEPSHIEKLRPRHFITISASRFEVFGYTILEAMAFGCPIVAPNVGGIPELITSEKEGILFHAGSAESLSAACQTLIDNHKLAAQLGCEARTKYLASFGTSRNAIHTAEFHRQAIEIFLTRDNPYRQLIALSGR